MTLTGLLASAMLIMRLFPGTPAARWLHLHLVELPMALTAKLGRKQAIMLFVCIAAAPSLAMFPAEIGLLVAGDLATYVDVMLVAYATAALSRSRGLAMAIRARLTRRPARKPQTVARARRSPRPRRVAKPANDGQDDGARVFAFAA